MPNDPGASDERATAWLSQGLEALLDDDNRTRVDGLDFDVIIVGSGYGGAVAAAELAGCINEAGTELRICLLERGKEYLAGMFPSRMADMAGHIRYATPGAKRQIGVHDGLYDMRWSEDAAALVASGLGGGSLINAGVMEMPLDKIFLESRWPKAIRDDRPELFELAGQLRPWLGARRAPKNGPVPAKTEALARLAGDNEFGDAQVTVAFEDLRNAAGIAMSACRRCGDCATGCNFNAKESLDL